MPHVTKREESSLLPESVTSLHPTPQLIKRCNPFKNTHQIKGLSKIKLTVLIMISGYCYLGSEWRNGAREKVKPDFDTSISA